ncbi:MAG TPA: hypothetical protein VKG82_08310 [Solirubrobacteraceae bacterium]|nr:hypothetical protein [Solirubrobacteraceae bacterium]
MPEPMFGHGCLPFGVDFEGSLGVAGIVGVVGVVGVGVVGVVGVVDGVAVLVVVADVEALGEAAAAMPATPPEAIALATITTPRLLRMCIKELLGWMW